MVWHRQSHPSGIAIPFPRPANSAKDPCRTRRGDCSNCGTRKSRRDSRERLHFAGRARAPTAPKGGTRGTFHKDSALPVAPYYDPSAEDSRVLAADRMLLLSGFHDPPALSPRDMRKDPTVAHQFRQNCLAPNDLAAELCQRAQTLGQWKTNASREQAG